MPQKIAIFACDLRDGGLERTFINLAAAIADRGIDVDLVLVRAVGPYLSQVPENVRVVNLGRRRVLQSVPALAGYLRREKPAGLITGPVNSNIAAVVARRLARVPTKVVVSEHFPTRQYYEDTKVRRLRLSYWLAPWLYRWADAIVAVSQGVADELARFIGIPEEKIKVIYNPVVTKDLPRLAGEAVDHPWFKPGEPPVILGVGRLSGEKDFATLIRAFAVLRAQREARLVILGDGPARETLTRLVEEKGLTEDVDLHGFVVNPYAMMSRAAVLAVSSKYEALSAVLIEALACGTQVASTDCPVGPREILEGERYGRLAPVGDEAALATAMAKAIDDPIPVSELKLRAEDFSTEKSATAYLGLFSI